MIKQIASQVFFNIIGFTLAAGFVYLLVLGGIL